MELNKQKATEWWMDHLAGELDEAQEAELMGFLKQNPALAEELEQSSSLWTQMDTVHTPEPSPAMDQRFEAMLTGYQSARKTPSFSLDMLWMWFFRNWQVGLASLIIGLAVGFLVAPKQNDKVDELASEVHDMKQMLMLTMIEKPQAQDRIKAVSMVSEIREADSKIIQSLISTLNQDKSVNVRLSALDALMSYGQKPEVRQALIESINKQDSPLLQVALADAMVALQEKSAVQPLNEVLSSPQLDATVKAKLQSTINTLKEI